jgi:predicted ATP-dependent Lon-type protease
MPPRPVDAIGKFFKLGNNLNQRDDIGVRRQDY